MASKSLDEHLGDYLRARRALGWDLSHTEKAAGWFLAWLAGRGKDGFAAQDLADWACGRAEGGARRAALATAVNPFARYLRALGVQAEPLAPKLVGRAGPRPDQRLLTAEEIRALGASAAGLFPNELRAATMKTMVGLGAATGMRIGEAVGLDEADLDPAARLLTIRRAKDGKERLNPLTESTTAALGAYLSLPARRKAQARTGCPAFFLSTAGTRLFCSSAHSALRLMFGAAGIGPDGRARPRWHSFRHGFATRSLEDAYRRGQDPADVLWPIATWLGHADPESSYYYLTASPALLGEAARKLEGGAA
jgi:integrase